MARLQTIRVDVQPFGREADQQLTRRSRADAKILPGIRQVVEGVCRVPGHRQRYEGEAITFIDQSKVPVARVALFAPDTIRLHPVKPPRSIVGVPMQPMLLVTINPMGMVFVTKINSEIDEELDTVDCAVRVLHAMQEHGFAVQQMLVVDTSTRVYGAVLDNDLRLGHDGS